MKKIPIIKLANGYYVFCSINGSAYIPFVLDTGCSHLVFSREVAEMLFLDDRISDSDSMGEGKSDYNGIFLSHDTNLKIKDLRLGRVKFKNLTACFCNRYGSNNLIGRQALEQAKDFIITKDSLSIYDGLDKEGVVIKTGERGFASINKLHVNSIIKKMEFIRSESKSRKFMFDYNKHIRILFDLYLCIAELRKSGKYIQIIEILIRCEPLLKNNIYYDMKHPDSRGAFISAYFNYDLGGSYFRAQLYKMSKGYLKKAAIFFEKGTTLRNDIDIMLEDIDKKLSKKKKGKVRIRVPKDDIWMQPQKLKNILHSIIPE